MEKKEENIFNWAEKQLERKFTIQEMLDCWEAAGEYEYRSNFGSVPTKTPNKKEYFEKFGITIDATKITQVK